MIVQLVVLGGQNRQRGSAILTLNELVFPFEVFTSICNVSSFERNCYSFGDVSHVTRG